MGEPIVTVGRGRTVTVFIPAFNEQENLAAAVAGALSAVEGSVDDYEIIILNACSVDGTGEIADHMAADHPKIRVIHRTSWYGLGANYMEGVRQASMEYFVMFPGDNENSWHSLRDSLTMIGSADVIVPYTMNQEVRTLTRRTISRLFVWLMNLLFQMRLRYFTGIAVYRVDDLRELDVRATDFAYNAEILIKLIKSGSTYRELGITIKPTTQTAIFNARNMVGVVKTIIRLFYEVNIRGRGRSHSHEADVSTGRNDNETTPPPSAI